MIEKKVKVKCKHDFNLDLNTGRLLGECKGIKVHKGEVFDLYVIGFNGIDMLSNERITFYFKRTDIEILFKGVDE